MASKADEVKHDTLEWEGQAIAYSWCHSRRRTLGITVRPDKSVSVRVPLRTALKDVRGFVSSRAEWILKVWKRLKARPAKQLQEYGRGTVFMYQGEALRLEFTKGLHRSLQRQDGLLILTTQDVPSEEVIRKMIDSWYRKQAVLPKAEALEHDRWFRSQVDAALAEADKPDTVFVPHTTVRDQWASKRQALASRAGKPVV